MTLDTEKVVSTNTLMRRSIRFITSLKDQIQKMARIIVG